MPKPNKTAAKLLDKAKKVRGKAPKLYRQDPYGNLMYRDSYGLDSPMGWQKDQITPKARGGSDSVRNQQALNTDKNRELSNTKKKRSRHSKRNK